MLGLFPRKNVRFSSSQSQGLKHAGLEFPSLALPAADARKLLFSALDWKSKGAKALLEHFEGLEGQLLERLNLCRYSAVPLGNLGPDPIPFCMDVFFSRFLKKENCLSWFGEGATYDDARALLPTDYLPAELLRPGFYPHFSVEVDIGLIALNAILQSEELRNQDKEVSSMMDFSDLQDDS